MGGGTLMVVFHCLRGRGTRSLDETIVVRIGTEQTRTLRK